MANYSSEVNSFKRIKQGAVITLPLLAFASVTSLGLQTSAQAVEANPHKPLDTPTLDFLSSKTPSVLDKTRNLEINMATCKITDNDGSIKYVTIVDSPDAQDDFLTLTKDEFSAYISAAKSNGSYVTKSKNSSYYELTMEEFLEFAGVSSYEEMLSSYKADGINVIEESLDSLLQEHIDSLGPEYYVQNTQSGYSLVNVPNKDLPGTITKFEYDKAQDKLVPKFYQMQLKKTEFGNADAPNELVYKTGLGQDISVKYDELHDASSFDPSTLQPSPDGTVTIDGKTFTGALGVLPYTPSIKKLNVKNTLFVKNERAISSSGTNLNSVEADFVANDSAVVFASINSLKGNFIQNGCGIDRSDIKSVEGLFLNNGTAIEQTASRPEDRHIDEIKADFIGNQHAIRNMTATIGDITGDFIRNKNVSKGTSKWYVFSSGIMNEGFINNIKGDFIENEYTTDEVSARGAAISNSSSWSSYYSGQVFINSIEGSFVANRVEALKDDAMGAAIANKTTDDDSIANIGEIKNSQFYNNSAVAKNGVAKGGAIYSDNDLNIVADNGLTAFSGNTVTDKNGTRNEAIYLDTDSYASDPVNTLTLKAVNNGRIYIDDQIVGAPVPQVEQKNKSVLAPVPTTLNKLKFTGDKTGTVVLNNNVKNLDVSLENTNLYLNRRDNVLANNNVTFQSGNFSMINNQVGQTDFASFNVAGKTNMYVDVDLANKSMDRITADTYTGNGTLNVAGMNLLSDAKGEVTDIKFAETGLMNKVTNGVSEVPTTYQTTAYTPIYKYNVVYDKRENDGGYFVFNKGGAIGGGGSANNPSFENFNPAVTGSSTAAQAGALGTVNQTFNYAFQSSDMFMSIPYLERVAMRNENKYALSTTGDATDVNGVYSPIYTKETSGGVWVKPYASIESIPLKNGPKVDNTTYGTLVGFDSDLTRVKKGWDRVITGYVGYTGASQHYAGVDSVQNGGLVGGTLTMYKGNFFNATTLSVGANVAQNTNMYGKEDFTMLMSGLANKSGYNIEFKEGRLILQPSMMMSYTFVNTFDYTNAAGVRIENKPLHAIQLSPGVKVVGNLKDGWQPYASASMVWNLMGESDATANGVQLAKMSVKPYVQYGVGVQKRVKDNFTAYGQAMVQNGGRNGISLSGGCRWLVGKGPKDVEKVDNGTKTKYTKERTVLKSIGQKVASGEKTILKQLSPAQKAALRGDKFNTTRTVSSGVLRQI